MEELENWNKIKNGNYRSFEKVFKAYYNDLYSYGMKLSGDSALTKDIIEEMFTYICANRQNINEVFSLKAYLLKCFRNRFLKALPKQNKLAGENHIEVDFDCSCEEFIIQNETNKSKAKKLKNALQNLSERQKEVIFLKYYIGLNYTEIEKHMGIRYQSIRNTVHQAISKLRETVVVENS